MDFKMIQPDMALTHITTAHWHFNELAQMLMNARGGGDSVKHVFSRGGGLDG
jgi:hypothetical protein